MKQGTTLTNTYYLAGGFQYKENVLQFFPYPEGYVNNTGGIYNYVFNYTDHLGNIRMSYSKDPATGTLKILEESHYYPFGLKHNNYNSDNRMFVKEESTTKIKPTPIGKLPEYKYKYNGKELQDELGLNLYDYGARNYDPALGRWMNIDPKAEQMRKWSPYNYCYDNPLRFTDPDGMKPFDDHFNSKGQFMYKDNKSTNNIIVHSKNFKNGQAELKNIIFKGEGEKGGYAILSNIATHYAKEAGVNLNKVHNGKISVADLTNIEYKGGREFAEHKQYNDGVHNEYGEHFSTSIMHTDSQNGKITIDLWGGQVDQSLNDANAMKSTLQHEGSKEFGHLENPDMPHSKIYQTQMKTEFAKAAPKTFRELLQSNYEKYKAKGE